MSVSRRSFLHRTLTLAGGIGLATAVSREASAKAAQSVVAYQPSPKGDQQCSNCKWFEPPTGCKLVDGPISASGWCKLWVKRA